MQAVAIAILAGITAAIFTILLLPVMGWWALLASTCMASALVALVVHLKGE